MASNLSAGALTGASQLGSEAPKTPPLDPLNPLRRSESPSDQRLNPGGTPEVPSIRVFESEKTLLPSSAHEVLCDHLRARSQAPVVFP